MRYRLYLVDRPSFKVVQLLQIKSAPFSFIFLIYVILYQIQGMHSWHLLSLLNLLNLVPGRCQKQSFLGGGSFERREEERRGRTISLASHRNRLGGQLLNCHRLHVRTRRKGRGGAIGGGGKGKGRGGRLLNRTLIPLRQEEELRKSGRPP